MNIFITFNVFYFISSKQKFANIVELNAPLLDMFHVNWIVWDNGGTADAHRRWGAVQLL